MSTLEAAVPDIAPEDMPVAVPATEEREQYLGGRLLAEITDRLVLLIREHYGRGPINAKTYFLDNLIVCVLSDGFIAIERTMMEGGSPDRVLELRREFQRLMETRYTEMVEELTGRKVLAFLSQAHVEPDLTVEMFLMDGRLPGFGALELVDPGDG
ncbi:MAG: Na-translocating system protein MpsC family protein [Solirubrobacteraceae bacterium]